MFVVINSIINATSEGVVQVGPGWPGGESPPQMRPGAPTPNPPECPLSYINWRKVGDIYHNTNPGTYAVKQKGGFPMLILPEGLQKVPNGYENSGVNFSGNFPNQLFYDSIMHDFAEITPQTMMDWGMLIPAFPTRRVRPTEEVEKDLQLIERTSKDTYRQPLLITVDNYKNRGYGSTTCQVSLTYNAIDDPEYDLTFEIRTALKDKTYRDIKETFKLRGIPGYLNFNTTSIGPFKISDSESYSCAIFDIVIGNTITPIYRGHFNFQEFHVSQMIKDFESWAKALALMGIARIPGAGPLISLVIGQELK